MNKNVINENLPLYLELLLFYSVCVHFNGVDCESKWEWDFGEEVIFVSDMDIFNVKFDTSE